MKKIQLLAGAFVIASSLFAQKLSYQKIILLLKATKKLQLNQQLISLQLFGLMIFPMPILGHLVMHQAVI